MSKPRYSEFRERIDIDAVEDAIGFAPLHTDNKGNDVGHCLFPQNHSHGDTTGKFAIHREKLVWGCWVCGGGDLRDLVMELYDWDSETAVEWLYQFSQHDLRSDFEFTNYLLDMLKDSDERVEKLPYFNPRVLGKFNGPLDYFKSRGIAERVIYDYNLCYSENAMKPAPSKGVGKDRVKIDEDYFGPTAIFPHWWRGKLVGWQHRWMNWDAERLNVPRWLAKYTNTTDFPAKTTLFNYDRAMHVSHNEERPVVVVESVPTVLFLESNEIPAVSFFGSHPSEVQLRLLRRFQHGVILAPDNDPTGDELLEAANYLIRFIPVYEADKVPGLKADLGDYAQADDPEMELLEHLAERVHRIGVSL